ncbi:MAG: tetratricopeptide repeat protein [Ignavibacteriaceae bacterium]
MKNLSCIITSFLTIILFSFQPTNAQALRNPDQGRPISRTPSPGNQGSISDRDRGNSDGKTKERNPPQPINPLQPVNPPANNPVKTDPVEEPYHPDVPPPHRPHPKPPYNPPVEEPPTITYPPEVIIIQYPDKHLEDNPLSEIKENESAILRYNEALKSNPKDTLLYYLRGNSKLVTGDYYGAIEDFTIYLNLVPWDKEAYYKRGLAFLYYGDQKDALLDFKIASELGYTKGELIMKKYN